MSQGITGSNAEKACFDCQYNLDDNPGLGLIDEGRGPMQALQTMQHYNGEFSNFLTYHCHLCSSINIHPRSFPAPQGNERDKYSGFCCKDIGCDSLGQPLFEGPDFRH